MIELAVLLPLYYFVTKYRLIPNGIKRLLLLSLMATPIFIGMKGVVSALYLADIIAPVLFVVGIIRYSNLTRDGRIAAQLLFALLIVVPLLGTAVNYGFISDSQQFTERGVYSLLLWIYRNYVYLSVFIIAASYKLDIAMFRQFLKALLVLCSGVILIGIINYLGIYDFSMYEQVLAWANPEFAYHTTNTTLGWGFLGMFRGAVGQLFANLSLLALAASLIMRGVWRVIALVIGVGAVVLLLCSLSRAGMVAAIIGPVFLIIYMGTRGAKLLIPIVVMGLLLIPIIQLDIVSERMGSVTGYIDSSERNRVDGWIDSVQYLSGDILTLMFGNGATNRSGVFKVIHAFGAHNEYIDVVFRAGIFGFISLTSFLFYYFRILVRKKRLAINISEKLLLSVAQAMLVSNMVIGITQDHLYRDYSGFASGIIMYLLYGVFLSLKPEPQGIKTSAKEVRL